MAILGGIESVMSSNDAARIIQEQFRERGYADKIGRDLDAQEAEAIYNELISGQVHEERKWNNNPQGIAGEISDAIWKNNFSKWNATIQAQATAYGIDLSQDQINEIRDSLINMGDLKGNQDQFNDLASATIYRYYQKSLEEPTVSDEQLEANKAGVNSVFQSYLGRDATQNEMDYFTDMVAKGASLYEIELGIQQTPEYLQKQAAQEQERVAKEAAAAREGLAGELLNQQQEAFRRAQPEIIASYMRAGRLGSSGLDAALARAQADLERERQGYLGNIAYEDIVRQQGYGREDFIGNRAAAFNQYLRETDPYYQRQSAISQMGTYRPYELADRMYARRNELDDYYRQRSDYERYLSQQRDRGSGALGAFTGMMQGIGAGAPLGPWGAIGMGAAGGIGGYYAYK